MAFVEPGNTLDIVGEDQSELFAVGPALPARGGCLGALLDGPNVAYFGSLPESEPTTNGQPYREGQERLNAVIEAIAEHAEERLNAEC